MQREPENTPQHSSQRPLGVLLCLGMSSAEPRSYFAGGIGPSLDPGTLSEGRGWHGDGMGRERRTVGIQREREGERRKEKGERRNEGERVSARRGSERKTR